MNQLRTFGIWLLALVFMANSDCSNKKLENDPPFTITDAYSQKWMAGVEMGGSGVYLIIPVSEMAADVKIDSVYFRGQLLELATKPGDDNVYVAHWVNPEKPDMTMSDAPNGEYGNPVPELNDSFKLTADECVIQYQQGGKTHYTKLGGIPEREQLNYPSAPNPDGGH